MLWPSSLAGVKLVTISTDGPGVVGRVGGYEKGDVG